jgi:hypothetical protein
MTHGAGFSRASFSFMRVSFRRCLFALLISGSQGFKHIFTSPSSVEKEVKATRSGNARIHGMTAVTTASIAYISTQVRPLPQPYQSNPDPLSSETGSLRPIVIVRILQIRHFDRLRALL